MAGATIGTVPTLVPLPMPAAPVLHLPPLHFQHAGGPRLFNALQLSLGAGLHWLQGDAGSGKTTLLRLLAADLPGLGPASLNGQPLDSGSTAWRQAVAWLDVRDSACDALTPAALMHRLQQQHPQLDPAAWQRHISGFGLAPHMAKTLDMLSTGMRRKAALAALLASGATLLLLDEPMAGLDGPSGHWLVQALAAWGRQPAHAALIACGLWPQGLASAGTVALPDPG